jgi:predicted Holliday junction resolvase-like endonuclease
VVVVVVVVVVVAVVFLLGVAHVAVEMRGEVAQTKNMQAWCERETIHTIMHRFRTSEQETPLRHHVMMKKRSTVYCT